MTTSINIHNATKLRLHKREHSSDVPGGPFDCYQLEIFTDDEYVPSMSVQIFARQPLIWPELSQEEMGEMLTKEAEREANKIWGTLMEEGPL